MPEEHLSRIMKEYTVVQNLYFCLIVISFYTLVRPAEILFLRWKHINMKKRYIWLPWSKNNPYGAGTYVRLLPPAYNTFAILAADYDGEPPANNIVFSMKQDSLNKWLQAICTRIGLPPYTWYATKHGGATYFALLGWTLRKIQAHGRWKSKASAKTYIHAPVKL